MSIYTRDNIPYSTMLQNAISNRNAAAQREAAYEQAKGKLWGDTATNIGKYAGRGLFAALDEYDEDEAELAKLLEEKRLRDEEAERIKANSEWASNQMEGYRPLYNMNGYIPEEGKMKEAYDSEYTNPYQYALMQDYYRRGR